MADGNARSVIINNVLEEFEIRVWQWKENIG
ncbi:MAG: hypothetical protein ACJASM_003088, partial [Salibacteraceae bacterium]